VGPIDSELPLEAEVAFDAHVGISRDDWDEEPAVVTFFADSPNPGLAAPQLTLVKPDLDAGGAERRANALSRLSIL
jgi:hypothetical protein